MKRLMDDCISTPYDETMKKLRRTCMLCSSCGSDCPVPVINIFAYLEFHIVLRSQCLCRFSANDYGTVGNYLVLMHSYDHALT